MKPEKLKIRKEIGYGEVCNDGIPTISAERQAKLVSKLVEYTKDLCQNIFNANLLKLKCTQLFKWFCVRAFSSSTLP